MRLWCPYFLRAPAARAIFIRFPLGARLRRATFLRNSIGARLRRAHFLHFFLDGANCTPGARRWLHTVVVVHAPPELFLSGAPL